MVKRYYCDFCNKSFQDNPQSRKRHLSGISHQRNRRMHYDSFGLQLAALPPQSKDAHILYSNLSGKEILQQWMAKHPEVVQKYRALEAADAKENRETKRRNYEVVDESQSGQQAATGIATQHQLPQELQPYREVLPPSLLPPAMRSQFPGSTDPPEWG